MKQQDSMNIRKRFTDFVHNLQDDICRQFESIDEEGRFREDEWEREGGGGGRTRVLTNGTVIEKGGVNVSAVYGILPAPVKKHFSVEQGWFYATGISLVIHPKSPMIPTVHANFRLFELYETERMDQAVDRWFGGGSDLTPYYLWDEDAVHFHRIYKEVCDRHGEDLYPRFKKECDAYFYNAHREESRGIGGLFFDYLRKGDGRSDEDWFSFTTDTGEKFMESYFPILKRRMNEPYNGKNRYWQEVRRGRYVEFNLIHDRGTLFGLKTNGRIESILMSLPPQVRWEYDFYPEPGTREAYLMNRLENPIDWISYGRDQKILKDEAG